MNNRERFLRAARCQAVDRPPIWLMRQAGRALPEYRALKEKYTFLDLVRTPELTLEVTLQPLRRFGFDAAILFSDILVVPEALGQSYQFRESGGVQLAFRLDSPGQVSRLHWSGVVEKTQYVAQALRLIKTELGDTAALLGFSGSPWTLLNFMVEGGSSRAFTGALAWARQDQTEFDAVMARLTRSVIEYLQMQIDAGADAVQLFDSLAGLLDPPPDAPPSSPSSGELYEALSGRWIRQILAALGNQVPVIVFCRGQHWAHWAPPAHPPLGPADASPVAPSVISVDWSVSLSDVRRRLPDVIGIQGNLDPAVLTTNPGAVSAAARSSLEQMQGRRGYLFNLGHGLPPTASVDNVAQLVKTVREFAWVN